MPIEVFTMFVFQVRYLLFNQIFLACQMSMSHTSLWCLGIFCNYNAIGIFQQEVAYTLDAILRVYNKVTPFDVKSEPGFGNVMRIGTKERTTKLISKIGKLLVVANLIHGLEFLQEVCFVLNFAFLVFFCLCNLFIFTTEFYCILLIEKHWATNDMLEMTLEKLQFIITYNTSTL